MLESDPDLTGTETNNTVTLLFLRPVVPVYFVSGCKAVLVSLGELDEFLRAMERTFIGQQPFERFRGAHIHSQRDEHTSPAETDHHPLP